LEATHVEGKLTKADLLEERWTFLADQKRFSELRQQVANGE
jgi:hypothetical protein